MKCAQPPQRPLQSLHIQAYTQTHCAATPHTCVQTIHTHTHQQPANNQPTNKPTNQPTTHPTNQPNSAVPEPINQQPTKQRNKQPSNPKTNSQPTNKPGTSAHGGGGGLQNLGGGRTKHTTDPHSSTVHNPARGGGGGAREEGWWEGATCTLDNPTPQTHMAGRREGVTHLPLGVTVYPLLDIHIAIKKTSTPAKRKWIPSLTLNTTSRGPTTQTTRWKGGGGADSLTLRRCLCGA